MTGMRSSYFKTCFTREALMYCQGAPLAWAIFHVPLRFLQRLQNLKLNVCFNWPNYFYPPINDRFALRLNHTLFRMRKSPFCCVDCPESAASFEENAIWNESCDSHWCETMSGKEVYNLSIRPITCFSFNSDYSGKFYGDFHFRCMMLLRNVFTLQLSRWVRSMLNTICFLIQSSLFLQTTTLSTYTRNLVPNGKRDLFWPR